MGKLLTSIVLAGAMAFGVGGCEKEKVYHIEFDGYRCEPILLGPNYLSDFHKDGYKSEIWVYENDDHDPIIKYIPATKESCRLDSQCGDHFDPVLTDLHEIDVALGLAQKCESLLEQKYNIDF